VEIAALCSPGPQGTTLADLRRTFERLGLHASGVKASVAELQEIERPAVLSVRNADGGGHFVVWLGYDAERDAVRLYSPPQWIGWMPLDAVERQSTGLALLVSRSELPEPSIVTRGVSPVLLWLWSGALVASGWSLIAVVRGRRLRSRRALLLGGVLAFMPGCADKGIDSPGLLPGQRWLESSEKAPLLSAEGRAVDFGRVIEGTELTHTFHVRNATDLPLRIVNVEKSCSCQTGTVRVGTVIAPKEVLDVPFTVPTKGTRGRLVRWLRLHTDSQDDALRTVQLEVTAELEAKLRAIPSQIVFGTLQAGEASKRLLRVESTAAGLVETFQQARSSHPEVSVELRERRPGALLFDVALAGGSQVGDVQGAITLSFSDAEYSELYVPLVGSRAGPLKVLPREIRVDHWIGGSPGSRVLRVISTTGTTFRITKVDCPDWISIVNQSDQAGVVLELKLGIGPGSGEEGGTIVIHTDQLGDITCPIRVASPTGL
jgi:hypothetical protein